MSLTKEEIETLKVDYDKVEWVDPKFEYSLTVIAMIEKRANELGCLPGELASLYLIDSIIEYKLSHFETDINYWILQYKSLVYHIFGE